MIDTRIIYGFIGSGKTTYIQDSIINDSFYKDGTTLILCFEQGEGKYDTQALQERRTNIAYYDGNEEIEDFCIEQIEKFCPGRIYVEMNTVYLTSEWRLPDSMEVSSVVTLIDFQTLDLLFEPFKQLFNQMVSESDEVIFRGSPSKELLAPYGQEFRLMNFMASYVRQDSLGHYEKAFDLVVPYSLEDEKITISEDDYLIFWLDAYEHPEHYVGKLICFSDPLELHEDENGWSAGRLVMICCMADIQYISFDLQGEETEMLREGWAGIEAFGYLGENAYGEQILKMELKAFTYMKEPEGGRIMSAAQKQ